MSIWCPLIHAEVDIKSLLHKDICANPFDEMFLMEFLKNIIWWRPKLTVENAGKKSQKKIYKIGNLKGHQDKKDGIRKRKKEGSSAQKRKNIQSTR